MIQLILIGGIILALGAAIWSYSDGQQKVGAAKVEAEYQRQQKEAEQQNTLRALEGEKYNADLLARALARNKAVTAQLAAAQKQRESSNDAQAKVDPEYKAWADTAVPLYVAASLRRHIDALTATADRSGLPAKPDLAPGTPVTGAAGAPDESWAAKLRRRLTGSSAGGMERSGQTGQ